MTKVTYYDKGDEISVIIDGHAGYDVEGSDIVCSAISMLGQTLLAYLDTDNEVFKYELRSGHIWAYAKGKNVRVAFNVIMAGYWLIQNSYPEHLKVDRGCCIQRSNPSVTM